MIAAEEYLQDKMRKMIAAENSSHNRKITTSGQNIARLEKMIASDKLLKKEYWDILKTTVARQN